MINNAYKPASSLGATKKKIFGLKKEKLKYIQKALKRDREQMVDFHKKKILYGYLKVK